jgi:ribose/xylose/arabinose/galactoside ABC-type transport system permease subunit
VSTFRGKDQVLRNMFRRENTILLAILIIIITVSAIMSGGKTISLNNIRNILLFSAATGIASIGQLFVLLTAGIDLSLAGTAVMVVLFGARLMTLTVAKQFFTTPVPVYQAIPLMLLAGLAVGAFNGALVSRLGIPALIVTLGVSIIAKGVGLLISMGSVYNLPREVAFFGQGEIGGIPVPVFIFFLVAVIAFFILNKTTFGKMVYAVGSNPRASYISGIQNLNVLLAVYMIAGFLAALAGLILLSYTLIATNVMAQGLELNSIAACVLGGVSLFGGRGSLAGVILGILIIGTINNSMLVLMMDPRLQGLVRAIVIFAAVAFHSWRREQK